MFHNILVPLDGSAVSEQALPTAVAVARACHAEIELVLAHVMAPFEGYADSSTSHDAKDLAGERYIRLRAENLARRTGLQVHGVVVVGHAAAAVCRRARDIPADLIVMTSHGRTGVSRAWMGSVADGVIRGSPVPVLMVRAETTPATAPPVEPSIQRILAPFDGSTASLAILAPAAELARSLGGTLVLATIVVPVPIYVIDPALPAYATASVDEDATKQMTDEAQEDLTRLAQRIEHDYGLRLETTVGLAEHVGPGLVRLAAEKQIDLIAMTTHSRGASRLVFGSVADKLLRGSRLPLLVLHPGTATNVDRPVSTSSRQTVAS